MSPFSRSTRRRVIYPNILKNIQMFPIFRNVPKYSQIFSIFPNPNWEFFGIQKISPNIPKYFQIFPNIPKYFQVFPNIPKYSQIFIQKLSKFVQIFPIKNAFPNIPKYFQIFSKYAFSLLRIFGKITSGNQPKTFHSLSKWMSRNAPNSKIYAPATRNERHHSKLATGLPNKQFARTW